MDWRDSVLPKRKRAPYRIISVMLSRNVRNGCPCSITSRCSEREPELEGVADFELIRRGSVSQWHPTSVFFKILFKNSRYSQIHQGLFVHFPKTLSYRPFRKSYFTKRHFINPKTPRHWISDSYYKSSRWQFSGFGKSSEQRSLTEMIRCGPQGFLGTVVFARK